MKPFKLIIAILGMALLGPALLQAGGRGPLPGAPIAGKQLPLGPGAPTGRSAACRLARLGGAPRHRFSAPSQFRPDSAPKALAFTARSHSPHRGAFSKAGQALSLPQPSLSLLQHSLFSRARAGWPRQWPIRPPPASLLI